MSLSVDKVEIHEASFFPSTERLEGTVLITAGRTSGVNYNPRS